MSDPFEVAEHIGTLPPKANELDALSDNDLIVYLWDRLGLKTEVAKAFLSQSFVNAQLFDKKQQDYGPGNIPGYGTFGVVVRMNDKFQRLKTLFGDGKKRRKPKNESIRDTLQDVSVYAIIALLVEEGKWPKS